MTKLLTRREAATYLRISERTLQRFRRRGLLPAVQVGRVLRFRVEDLEGFLLRHRA